MIPIDQIPGRVFAAARVLAGLSQAELAWAADVSTSTVERVEEAEMAPPAGVLPNNLAAIRAILEAAGVEFISEDGGGVGVRMRKAGAAR